MIAPLICRGTCRICYCIFSSNPRLASKFIKEIRSDTRTINRPICRSVSPVVERLRQGGRGGGRCGEARRVGMVRRLLQGLDQVVPVLRVYGPEGTFAYALKDRKERDITGNVTGSLKAKRQTRRRGSPTRGSECRTRPVHTGPCSTGR